jgi:hypothetical protein
MTLPVDSCDPPGFHELQGLHIRCARSPDFLFGLHDIEI